MNAEERSKIKGIPRWRYAILSESEFNSLLADSERAERLEKAIKDHRSQKLDDRCWLDDQKLYESLGDGIPGDNSAPSMEKMLSNCKRYLERRCNPQEQWKSYQELEKENAELRKDKERLDWLLKLIYDKGTEGLKAIPWSVDEDGELTLLDRPAIDAAMEKWKE